MFRVSFLKIVQTVASLRGVGTHLNFQIASFCQTVNAVVHNQYFLATHTCSISHCIVSSHFRTKIFRFPSLFHFLTIHMQSCLLVVAKLNQLYRHLLCMVITVGTLKLCRQNRHTLHNYLFIQWSNKPRMIKPENTICQLQCSYAGVTSGMPLNWA